MYEKNKVGKRRKAGIEWISGILDLGISGVYGIVDLKERVIKPYVFGHSFTFSGIDLVLASVHQFRVYASDQPIQDVNEEGVKEVTREVMESVKI